MSMEGSLKRGKTLLNDPGDYDKIINHLKDKMKYPEFVNFFSGKSGQSEFKNYQDVKRFLQTEVLDAFERASEKLKKIEGSVDLVITQLETSNSVTYDCREVLEDGYSYTVCDQNKQDSLAGALPALTYSVDANDLKILASGIKGYATAFKLYTAYSIAGYENVSNEVTAKESKLGRSLTDQELHRIFKKYPDFMTLESDHRMNEITGDLENIVEVGMDLEALNNKFCDNDLRASNLIKSICFDASAREGMQQALDSLSGPREVALGNNSAGEEVKILANLPAFLSNPVADLKSLLPSEYDENGKSVFKTEPNLNGLFPNKDLLEKLEQLESKK